MTAAGGNEHAVTGADRQVLPVDPEREGALEDLEPLALERVHVRGRHEARGPDGALEHDRLAVRLGRRPEEGDALPRDRVLDRVASAEHRKLLLSVSRPTLGRTEGAHIAATPGRASVSAGSPIPVPARIAVSEAAAARCRRR